MDQRAAAALSATGLDREQGDWLYKQLDAMIEWDTPTGRRALPMYTVLVMVLFALRHNLPPDVPASSKR